MDQELFYAVIFSSSIVLETLYFSNILLLIFRTVLWLMFKYQAISFVKAGVCKSLKFAYIRNTTLIYDDEKTTSSSHALIFSCNNCCSAIDLVSDKAFW